jgi:hypothetical protein
MPHSDLHNQVGDPRPSVAPLILDHSHENGAVRRMPPVLAGLYFIAFACLLLYRVVPLTSRS